LTVHDRRFLTAIVEQGHSPAVVCLSNGTGKTNLPEPGMDFSVSPAAELAALAVEYNADVAHAGPVPTVGFLAATHLPRDLPLVVVSWGRDVLLDCDQDAALHEQALLAIDRADSILVDCEAVRRKILSWRPALNTPFVSFPWGVDLKAYDGMPRPGSAVLRQQLGWQDCAVFVSTRSWEPIYGIDVLLAAFANVAKLDKSVRLLLVGDGALRSSVSADISARGLLPYVHTPGRIAEADLPIWYGAADIYISSSPCDGSSVSLLEAMASGLPTIAHFEHGNPEWITPGSNGWLTDCRDANRLADCMRDAVKRRGDWSAMGAIGRAKTVSHANWARNCLGLTDAYRLAIGQEPRP
jgi:glycosyltransferase involved in cell wall biosynthesis